MDRLNALARRLPVPAVWGLGLLPLAWLVWLAVTDGLGADPVAVLERSLGERALQFLIATLCVSPLRRVGLNLLRFRRALGLLAFTYACLHLAVWLGLDMALRWSEIGRDLVKRPYIILGMIAFLSMLPLALTSTDSAIRRMGGAAWRRLHRLVYLAALAAAAHYVLLVKAWPTEPLVYAGVVFALLALRGRWFARRRAGPVG